VNTKQSIPSWISQQLTSSWRRSLREYSKSALHTAGFIGGPVVEQFEQAFAKFCGTTHCIGVEMEPMRCGSHWRPPA